MRIDVSSSSSTLNRLIRRSMPLFSISQSRLWHRLPVSSRANGGRNRGATRIPALSRSATPSHPLRLATTPPEMPSIRTLPEIRPWAPETSPDHEIPGIQRLPEVEPVAPETDPVPRPHTPVPGRGPESPIPPIPSPPAPDLPKPPPDVDPPETPEILPPRPPPPDIFPPPEIDPPPTTPPDIHPPGAPEIVPPPGGPEIVPPPGAPEIWPPSRPIMSWSV